MGESNIKNGVLVRVRMEKAGVVSTPVHEESCASEILHQRDPRFSFFSGNRRVVKSCGILGDRVLGDEQVKTALAGVLGKMPPASCILDQDGVAGHEASDVAVAGLDFWCA